MSTVEKRSPGVEARRELIDLDRLILLLELQLEGLCDLRKILEERIDGGSVREWIQ